MSLRSEFRTSGCVWDAKFLEGGDIVTACSGGVAGIWTVRDGMIADQMEIDAYDYQLSQYKLCRKKVGGMKHDELLGIDALMLPGATYYLIFVFLIFYHAVVSCN
ncbi:unnamed protein product [Brassica rapa subsp. trilocularis]